MVIDSEEIKKDVVNQLYWDDRVDASRVKVEVIDSNVVLSGVVQSFSARRAAETDASMIPGVSIVDNHLNVKLPPALPAVTDEKLKSRIENIFLWNAVIDTSKVNVSVKGGHVTLEGNLDAFWKKMRAEDLVADLLGVLSVTNAITVVPTESPSDRVIADNITAAIRRVGEIDINSVDISVRNGVVNLAGTVPSLSARQMASNIAWHTAGTINVENGLIVS